MDGFSFLPDSARAPRHLRNALRAFIHVLCVCRGGGVWSGSASGTVTSGGWPSARVDLARAVPLQDDGAQRRVHAPRRRR